MAVDSKAVGNLSCAFGLKLPVIFKTAFQVTVSRAVTQPNTTEISQAPKHHSATATGSGSHWELMAISHSDKQHLMNAAPGFCRVLAFPGPFKIRDFGSGHLQASCGEVLSLALTR